MTTRCTASYSFTILILLLLCTSAGCLKSYGSEIDKATTYIDSANARLAFLDSIDLQTVWVGSIKANASAAKSDLAEASRILNAIPRTDLSSQDQADLKATIVLVDVDMKLCDLLAGPFSDYIENSQKYSKATNPSSAASNILSMKTALKDMDSSATSMTDEMNSVDETALSPEVRSTFVSMKSMIGSFSEGIRSAEKTLETECTTKCYSGQVLGTDCKCHPACGSSYCSADATCCNGRCYTCPSGYFLGSDCLCH